MSYQHSISHYQDHGNVDYGCDSSRLPALDPAQMKNSIKLFDETDPPQLLNYAQSHNSAKPSEQSNLIVQESPSSKSKKIKRMSTIDSNLLYLNIVLVLKNGFLKMNVVSVGAGQIKLFGVEATPGKGISYLRAHIYLISFIWCYECVFNLFDHWLNSDTYCATVDETLSEEIEALNGFIYVSDGIRWHRRSQFSRWCEQHDIDLCNWPGYSAGSNPNELVRNIIKHEIKNKNPKSQRQLENAVDEACRNLSLNVVRSYIKKTQTIYSHVVSSY